MLRGTAKTAVLLSFILVFGALAASGEEIVITYAGWGTPQQIASREAEVEAFYRTYPDTPIRIELQFSPWEVYHDSLIVQAASGVAPDVMIISLDRLPSFYQAGILRDISEFFERDGLDPNDFAPLAIEAATFDGQLVGLPTHGAIPGGAFVAYNRHRFEEAGLPLPDTQWTWDDFLTYASRLTMDRTGDGEIDFWGTNIGKSTFSAVWEYHIRAHGGDLWNEDFTESTINSPIAQDTFRFLKDLDEVYRVSDMSVRQAEFFADGSVGMTVNWDGWVENMLLTYDFAEAATMPRGPAGYGLSSARTGRHHSWTISTQTEHPEAAWEFIKFLATHPAAVEARHFPDVPYIPNLAVWFAKLPERLVPYYMEVRSAYAAEEMNMEMRRINRLLPDVEGVLRPLIWEYYDGVVSITEALNNAARILTAQVRELNQ